MNVEGASTASAGSVTDVASDESIDDCCERRTMVANTMMRDVMRMIAQRESKLALNWVRVRGIVAILSKAY